MKASTIVGAVSDAVKMDPAVSAITTKAGVVEDISVESDMMMTESLR